MRFPALTFLFTLVLALVISVTAFARVEIPRLLTRADRHEAIRVLGFGTSAKILSDPYPLGGYEGLEAGISVENLPVEDLGRLGSTLTTPQKDIAYPKLSIGKGLYQNLDFFVHFIPYSQKTELSQYGGILRYGAYQGKFLPLSLAVSAHFNNTNISNLVSARAFGLDLIGGINVENVALYVGGGPVQCRGRFIGEKDAVGAPATSSVTESGLVETEIVDGFHTVIGANVHISRTFLAVQIDRYVTTVYSAKLGLRY